MLKALHSLTGCKVKLEQPVYLSDEQLNPTQPSTSTPLVSERSVPDGVVYMISYGGALANS